MIQRLLNLAEAADALGYSVSGFRKLIRSGRGPQFMRAGRGNFKFRPEWIADFVEAGASPAPSQQKKHPAKIDGVLFGFDPDLLSL